MIHLDYRDSRPIYEQVKDSLRRLMVTGVLAPGDKLPSVRSMASQLPINPNTISGPMPSWSRKGMWCPSRERAASWRRAIPRMPPAKRS